MKDEQEALRRRMDELRDKKKDIQSQKDALTRGWEELHVKHLKFVYMYIRVVCVHVCECTCTCRFAYTTTYTCTCIFNIMREHIISYRMYIHACLVVA